MTQGNLGHALKVHYWQYAIRGSPSQQSCWQRCQKSGVINRIKLNSIFVNLIHCGAVNINKLSRAHCMKRAPLSIGHHPSRVHLHLQVLLLLKKRILYIDKHQLTLSIEDHTGDSLSMRGHAQERALKLQIPHELLWWVFVKAEKRRWVYWPTDRHKLLRESTCVISDSVRFETGIVFQAKVVRCYACHERRTLAAHSKQK